MSTNTETLKKEWAFIKLAFPFLNEPNLQYNDKITKEELIESLNRVENSKLIEYLHSIILNKLENYVSENVSVHFWSTFTSDTDIFEGFRSFYKAIELLYNYYIQLLPVVENLFILREKEKRNKLYGKDNPKDLLKLIFKGSLLARFPPEKNGNVQDFYKVSLRLEDNPSSNYENEQCKACLFKDCVCNSYFCETNQKLFELDLIEPLMSQILKLVNIYIEEHIEKTCKDSYDVSHLKELENWLSSVILEWIRKVFCYDSGLFNNLEYYNKIFKHYLYETYTKSRINQLFNIIIEYPESLPALEDLRICLPETDLRSYLTKKMQQSMEKRLLHPGVSTPDILTAYIATIRSMRELDPSGLLLETVTQPVHQYLRSREDTIRCVVSSLTEEGLNDLAEELVRAEEIQIDENTYGNEDMEKWENWTPDPIDSDPTKSVGTQRNSDIISMLVNVYGSKELFVNEYRTLLADRLLSQLSCDTEKEIRYLELLKLRFGESQLHYCEVMLKDIANSKRINQHIKQKSDYNENDISMSGMIVSAQFWPPFKSEELNLHPRVKSQMEEYTRAFETLKGNRTLCWKNHLGIVNLEIELADKTLELSVTPIYATILMHFQDKNVWKLDELSHTMHVPPTVLRRKIGFWQSHRIIAETSQDSFCLVEEEGTHQPIEVVEDFESESVMASTQDQREEELQTFWSYIVGMLINLDTLSLERIHQMLKMFAFQGPTLECSLEELQEFLDRKVRDHQLIYTGGLYRLPL